MPKLFWKLDLFIFANAESFEEEILELFTTDFVVVEFEVRIGFHYFLFYQIFQVSVILCEGCVGYLHHHRQVEFLPFLLYQLLLFHLFGDFLRAATFAKIQRFLLFGFGFVFYLSYGVLLEGIVQKWGDEGKSTLAVHNFVDHLLDKGKHVVVEQGIIDEELPQEDADGQHGFDILTDLDGGADEQVLAFGERGVS